MKLLQAVASILPRSWRHSDNIFGSIARGTIIPTNADFIPTDNAGGIMTMGGGDVSPQWLGLNTPQQQMNAYLYCSPLASVIDRLAEADTNGRMEFLNLDGTTITNYNRNPRLSRIMKLMKRPNPFQTWDEFNSQQVVLCKIFGYCPVFAVGPEGMDKTYTKSFWNINPVYCTYELDYTFDMFAEGANPIKGWSFNILGKTYTIPSSDILLVKDGFIDALNPTLGIPISKVSGLDYVISNICASMEADNVLLKKKGPLGVFSYDPKPDIAGWQPLNPTEKKDLQGDLSKYGLTWDKLQYVISKVPLKWNAMSFNVRDLMTKETVRQGTDFLCDRFAYPAELMSGKNATYENRSSAEKYLYQNNIIPFSIRRMEKYTIFFGLEDSRLHLDYDHLPVLQEDIMSAGQARKSLSDSISIDWNNGLVTWNECRILQGMDTISGMDIYIHEYNKKFKIEKDETEPAKIKPVKAA